MERTREKPDIREKALKHGITFPFDEELVMLILGSGTKNLPVDQMASKIVETLDNSETDKIVENLCKVKGIGVGKALAIAAAIELGRRRNNHLRAPICTPRDIVPFVRNYAVSPQEHFLVVTLNGGYEIIQIHCISVGILNKALVHPREVFNLAIKENAACMIVCHNHPSGISRPSKDDIETTKILIQAANIIGIPILDHIIVDCENYFSFMENHILFTESQ